MEVMTQHLLTAQPLALDERSHHERCESWKVTEYRLGQPAASETFLTEILRDHSSYGHSEQVTLLPLWNDQIRGMLKQYGECLNTKKKI